MTDCVANTADRALHLHKSLNKFYLSLYIKPSSPIVETLYDPLIRIFDLGLSDPPSFLQLAISSYTNQTSYNPAIPQD